MASDSTTTTTTITNLPPPTAPERKRVALVTGANGQDGSYLCEFLLSKGYAVHGMIRKTSGDNIEKLADIKSNPDFVLHYGDVTDVALICALLLKIRPDELYNLAAQSHVQVSNAKPIYTAMVDGIAVLQILDAIRTVGLEKKIRFYQASTSEMFGKVQETPQTEKTPFYPRSPYAVAKLFAHWSCVNHREGYGMFICSGILFNHESPRRGHAFVTRKITLGVADIVQGRLDCLVLGNLDAKRDWGHAKEYVQGMWKMLQAPEPDDYIIATGETHSVQEFTDAAFKAAGWQITWKGEGIDKVGVDEKGRVVVKQSPEYYRPAEVELLLGDPSKMFTKLGWKPTMAFDDIVADMMKHDLAHAQAMSQFEQEKSRLLLLG